MTTENISSPEESQEAAETLQSSSQKQCNDDNDCPPGCRCVNGTCEPGSPEEAA
jgi:hypothetical protein